MRPLKTFLRLPFGEQIAFLRAWLKIAQVKTALARVGLRGSLAALPEPAMAAGGTEWPRPARWVPVAARYYPGGARCLVRSLALMQLLRAAGLPCELRIGVGAIDPSLDTHAWVEIGGVPVTDTDSRYRAFAASSRK